MKRVTKALALVCAWAALPGCFDSTWGEAKRVQQHNAQVAAPAELHAASADAAPEPPAHTYRVRIYATASYASQTFDWKRKAEDLLSDANHVLVPAIGVRLEAADYREWAPPPREDDLTVTVDALKAKDAGADVDWVVGMVGSFPRVTRSFHDLGMAEMKGKHLVVRAAGELEEQVAIEKNFNELSEGDRASLIRARQRHRASAVFLHEVGHTLGAEHQGDARSLMSPQYDPHMEAYGEASTAEMRTILAHRNDPPPAPAAPSPPPQPEDPPDIAALPEADRALYGRVKHAYETGDVATAAQEGRPLFTARTGVYTVQDLRCKVALAQGLPWDVGRAECDPLMKLAVPGVGQPADGAHGSPAAVRRRKK